MTTLEPGQTVRVEGYEGIAFRVIGPETERQYPEPVEQCTECDGTGEVTDDDSEWVECENCEGEGETYYEPDVDDYEDVPTGRIETHMVGDDRVFAFDPDELSPLKLSEFCSECGQIGCGHGAYNDEDGDE